MKFTQQLSELKLSGQSKICGFVHLKVGLVLTSSIDSGRGVVSAASVSEVVLDSANVEQRVHVVEPAPSSRLLELNGMRGLVLGQPELVHGVVPAEFPPQPRVVSVDVPSGSDTRVGRCVHFRICVPQPVHPKACSENESHKIKVKLVVERVTRKWIPENCTKEKCYH